MSVRKRISNERLEQLYVKAISKLNSIPNVELLYHLELYMKIAGIINYIKENGKVSVRQYEWLVSFVKGGDVDECLNMTRVLQEKREELSKM